jgi:hypothetical protein
MRFFLAVFLLFALPMQSVLAACPSCSNPNLSVSRTKGNIYLEPGKFQLDYGFQSSLITVIHLAECPDVAPIECAKGNIPLHKHNQSLFILRGLFNLSFGLFPNVVLLTNLPVEMKSISIKYTTLDGQPFSPPYGDIHHRNETLFGLSDAGLAVKYYLLNEPGNLLNIQLGTSVPLGKTEEDPYQLTEKGLTHQHLQFGTGTFMPSLGLEWSFDKLFTWSQYQGSFYSNNKGYFPGWNIAGGIGYGFNISNKFSLIPQIDTFYQSTSAWHNVVDDSSERFQIGASLSFIWNIRKNLSLVSQLKVPVYKKAPSEAGNEFTEPVILYLGMSQTL